MPACHRCSTSVTDGVSLATCATCGTNFHHRIDCGKRIEACGRCADVEAAVGQCPKCAKLCICVGGPVNCHAGLQRLRRHRSAEERSERRQKRIQEQQLDMDRRIKLRLAFANGESVPPTGETVLALTAGSPGSPSSHTTLPLPAVPASLSEQLARSPLDSDSVSLGVKGNPGSPSSDNTLPPMLAPQGPAWVKEELEERGRSGSVSSEHSLRVPPELAAAAAAAAALAATPPPPPPPPPHAAVKSEHDAAPASLLFDPDALPPWEVAEDGINALMAVKASPELPPYLPQPTYGAHRGRPYEQHQAQPLSASHGLEAGTAKSFSKQPTDSQEEELFECEPVHEDLMQVFGWQDVMNLKFIIGACSAIASVVCLTVLLVSVWKEPSNSPFPPESPSSIRAPEAAVPISGDRDKFGPGENDPDSSIREISPPSPEAVGGPPSAGSPPLLVPTPPPFVTIATTLSMAATETQRGSTGMNDTHRILIVVALCLISLAGSAYSGWAMRKHVMQRKAGAHGTNGEVVTVVRTTRTTTTILKKADKASPAQDKQSGAVQLSTVVAAK